MRSLKSQISNPLIMKRYFLLLTISWLSSVLTSHGMDKGAFEQYFKLLPKPQTTELIRGRALNSGELKSLYLKGGIKRPKVPVVSLLPVTSASGKGILTLEIVEDNTVPESAEGYTLQAGNGQVLIRSRGEAGLFYGCQTLAQLLEDAHDQNLSIPAVKITDYPGVPYRSVHWDLKYHLDNQNYYYELIDRLAKIKVNAVIVEFEDKLKYRQVPVIGAGNAISIEEFAALCRYARERHIEISPLVQGLGHVSFILKHDQYKKLRDDPSSDWVFDPLNPEVYQLQFKLYEDAIKATPGGKYLHVGGDEVYNLGRSELSKKSGMKTFELQMYWLNKVCEFARLHNRTPIFWDDMVFSLAGLYMTLHDPKLSNEEVDRQWKEKQHIMDENVHLFPKDCIYMRWHYANPKLHGNIKAIDWFKSHNFKVMAASATQDMNAMLPRRSSIFGPTKDFSEVTTEKKLEGILTTAWDDSSPHFETYMRGFHDFASLTWNYQNISSEESHKVFRHRFYAPAVSDPSYEFQDSLETALYFWDTALIEDGGNRSHYPKEMNLIGLPGENKISSAWSELYKMKLQRAKVEIARYELIKKRIDLTRKAVRRNRFAVDYLYQMNELQVYPAKLLLLLEEFDKASTTDKQVARQKVIQYVEHFSKIRAGYEDVFSRTRFIRNPEGYILDQNNDHMLANGTNTSDWMHVFELAFNDKIKQWLNKP